MPQLVIKPLSWFKTNPQARKIFDDAELRLLGESLKVKQLQPLLCQPDGTVIAGERRLRAGRLVGLEELEAKIADEQLDETRIMLWQMWENKLHEHLKPAEEVDGVAEIAQKNPQWTGAELAVQLKMAPAQVSKCLTIKACNIAYTALADGRLGLSDAYTVAKAAPGQKEGLIALKLGGASREQLEKAARKQANGEQTVRLSRVSIPLSTGAKVVVSGAEIDLEALIETLAAALELARKANKESLDVRTFEKVAKDKAVA